MAAAVTIVLPANPSGAEPAADSLVVLARATDVVLDAVETLSLIHI